MQWTTPLLDRELFFGNPKIAGGKLSPDGQYVSFIKEYEGIMNIWVKGFDQAFEEALPLTVSKSPVLGYFWTYDSKYILYINDKEGDENMNIFAVLPELARPDLIPDSTNLTPLEEVAAQIYAVSKKDPDTLFIGINDRDKAWHDLYKLSISTGNLEMWYENNNRLTGWEFDWDEQLRLAYRTDEQGNSEILRVDHGDSHTFTPIYGTTIKESAYVAGWTPDNAMCYLVTNKGELDLSSLFLLDPNTGHLQLVEQDPKNEVDFGGLFLHEDTREILYTSYTADKKVRYWKNEKWRALFEYLQEEFPAYEIGFSSFTKDLTRMLVAISGDNKASEVYFFDSNTKELVLQYTPRPELKMVEEHLSAMHSIHYASSDGLRIPAYLSLPKDLPSQDLPLVTLVHGGPKGPRDYWGYDPLAQFLTNRGYAVLQPNFRASGGYGKAFLNAGDKQWGKLMQDDITYGVRHLVAEGTVDPKRVAIMGGSYGGYATLAGLAFTPELYACGVDIVGPSNLFTLLESIPPYWESGRAWLYDMVGDPDTEEGQRLLREASPLFSVDKIDAPLLIVQGANDPRVKQAESDQIVLALREKGRDVDYLLAKDEGHGFRKPLNRMALYALVEAFLSRHLGGRYQESIPEGVKKTLENIMVDISTVTYEPNHKIEVAERLPIQQNPLIAIGVHRYKCSLRMPDDKLITFEIERRINIEDSQIVVQEKADLPTLNSIDTALYDSSLKPIKRTVAQADQLIYADFEDARVTIHANGSTIELEGKGSMLHDGPGIDILLSNSSIGAEPTYISVLDLAATKAKTMKLTPVMASDDTLHCYLQNTENENDYLELWIDKTLGLATRIIKKMNEMPGAEISIEKI